VTVDLDLVEMGGWNRVYAVIFITKYSFVRIESQNCIGNSSLNKNYKQQQLQTVEGKRKRKTFLTLCLFVATAGLFLATPPACVFCLDRSIDQAQSNSGCLYWIFWDALFMGLFDWASCYNIIHHHTFSIHPLYAQNTLLKMCFL
jgi:hypothetical protein